MIAAHFKSIIGKENDLEDQIDQERKWKELWT